MLVGVPDRLFGMVKFHKLYLKAQLLGGKTNFVVAQCVDSAAMS
jgi:hypothetical protein